MILFFLSVFFDVAVFMSGNSGNGSSEITCSNIGVTYGCNVLYESIRVTYDSAFFEPSLFFFRGVAFRKNVRTTKVKSMRKGKAEDANILWTTGLAFVLQR